MMSAVQKKTLACTMDPESSSGEVDRSNIWEIRHWRHLSHPYSQRKGRSDGENLVLHNPRPGDTMKDNKGNKEGGPNDGD